MRKRNKTKCIAAIMLALVISMPFAFAAELKLVYDANGNLVGGDGKYRVYNSLNQLWKIYNGTGTNGTLLQEYTYHPLEERVLVKKSYSGGALSETVYYWSKNFVRVVNSSGTFDYTYVYHEGNLVAQEVNGVKSFVSTDHKGSVVAVTSENKTVIGNTSYSPLGEITSGGDASRYDYEAKEADSLIGDVDFNARRYDPSKGIFTQPDTIIQNTYDPQSLNRYMFERGNAYNSKDDDGHNPYVVAAVAGFVVGSVAYMLTTSGSGWSHVANTYKAGLAGAAAGVALCGAGTVLAAVAPGAALAMAGTATAGISAVGPETFTGSLGASISIGQQMISNVISGRPLMEGTDKAASTGYMSALAGSFAGSFMAQSESIAASSGWSKGTFSSKTQSLEYHYDKHVVERGIPMSRSQYSANAKAFFDARNSDLANVQSILLKGSNTQGLKITLGDEMGMYTESGDVVSYHPPR